MKVDLQTGNMGRLVSRSKGRRKGSEEVTLDHVPSDTDEITPRSKNDKNNNYALPPQTNGLNKSIGEPEDSADDDGKVSNIVGSQSDDENDNVNEHVSNDPTDDFTQQFSQLNIRSEAKKLPEKQDNRSNDSKKEVEEKIDLRKESKPDVDAKETDTKGEALSRGPERLVREVNRAPYSRSQEIRVCSSNRTSGGSVSVGPALSAAEESLDITRDLFYEDQLSTGDTFKDPEVELLDLMNQLDPKLFQKLPEISLADFDEVVGNNPLPDSSNNDLMVENYIFGNIDSPQGYGSISPQLGFDTSYKIYEGISQESSSSYEGYGASSPESLPSAGEYHSLQSPPHVPSPSVTQGSPPYSPSAHLYSPQSSHNSSECYPASLYSPPSSPEQQLPTVLAHHQSPVYVTNMTSQNIPTVSTQTNFQQSPPNISTVASQASYLPPHFILTPQKIPVMSSASQNIPTASSQTTYLPSQNISVVSSQAQISAASLNVPSTSSQLNMPTLAITRNTSMLPCQASIQQAQISALMNMMLSQPQPTPIQQQQNRPYRQILPAPGPIRVAKQELENTMTKDTRNKLVLKFACIPITKLTEADADGDTKLMIAVCNNNVTMLRESVYGIVEAVRKRAPENLNAKNKTGQTALYNACIIKPQRPLDVIAYLAETLLELKIDIAKDRFHNGKTLVQCVRQTKNIEVLDFLLKLETPDGKLVFNS